MFGARMRRVANTEMESGLLQQNVLLFQIVLALVHCGHLSSVCYPLFASVFQILRHWP